jgi:hypothetical protein
MKTITLIKQPDGSFKTSVGEMTPTMPLHPRTVGHSYEINRAWTHHVQIDAGWLFVKRPRRAAVAISLDEIVQLAILADPMLSHPPVFIKHPAADSLSVTAASKLEGVSYQWQKSADGKTWENLEGETRATCNTTGLKHVRVVATNAAGQTESNPCQLPP